MDHLNDALCMEANFTYSSSSSTKVSFAHSFATMRMTFSLEDNQIPAKLEFTDGDYATYTINMSDVSSSDSYTVYYVIFPHEGGERNLSYGITTIHDELYYYKLVCSTTYYEGQNYIATIPGLTLFYIPDGYTPIYFDVDLYNIRDDLSGQYILMNDITLSGYDNWTPIGTSSNYFSGVFSGGGFTISGLNINSEDDYQGLFGYVSGATIKNVIVKEPSIQVGQYSGAVVGYFSDYSVTSCYYLEITGTSYTNEYGTASSEATMKASSFVTTLNSAAGSTYFKQDTNNYNDGYPILVGLDYN